MRSSPRSLWTVFVPKQTHVVPNVLISLARKLLQISYWVRLMQEGKVQVCFSHNTGLILYSMIALVGQEAHIR